MDSHWKQNLALFREKMKAHDLAPVVIDTFAYYFRQVATGETGLISNRDIRPVQPDEIVPYEDLDPCVPLGQASMKNAIMIRLNGGLGTSMGLTGPKSLLPVKNGKSFLEIIVGQAHSHDVTLALMNSFSTHNATLAALGPMAPEQKPLLFTQNKFPKIRQNDLAPAHWPDSPALEWNPPGHGDIFTALLTSGILDDLVGKGIKYAFIANSDNLGAAMDPGLLGYFAEHRVPFMMEVAEKTPSDIKGGHLARRHNGRLILRESAQCPEDELDTFQDIEKYRYFNTNNIWVNLLELRALFKKEGAIHLPIIVNSKPLDPRNENSPPVFQIETAMGAAVSLFQNSVAVRVPRHRFIPVKKCNDLMAVRSNCYRLHSDFSLRENPARILPVIRIYLEKQYYHKIDDFDSRFASGVPSLIDCESLSIEGDVAFEAGVVIRGRVVIKNFQQTQMIVRSGTIIDNEQIVKIIK
jgi:UTP--glucose-1-phosphate uridylyltransferase